jgi:predicted PurR-regulated permease PerM
MHLHQPNWTRILTILLVILASLALLYISFSVLLRFTQAILLFVLGAILAYILMPLVNRLQSALHFRWLAILLAYSMVAVCIFGLGVLLFTPFIQQSKSLVDNLQNPSPNSLVLIKRVSQEASALQVRIRAQTLGLRITGQPLKLDLSQIRSVEDRIAILQMDVTALENGTVSGTSHTARATGTLPLGHLPPNPQPQTRVPASYVDLIAQPVRSLSATYVKAISDPRNINIPTISMSVDAAKRVTQGADQMYHIMSTTPILLIRSQRWLEDHGIKVDVHDKFGQAASQVSGQSTNILDNAITIISKTANALLDITLILIISFYLLMDGHRLIKGALDLLPGDLREHGAFFLSSLDRVLGGYIRGQLFLSLLAGILGGGGAAALGVPYPLLIGIATFLLECVPVIGPMVTVVPAVAISLFFNMPVVTTVALLIWFIIFQQIVTNILGPRIMGMAVGIHPLEALLAVLIGFPLGGFLGAFLSVPVMGIVHILIREAYNYFVLGKSLPVAPVEPEPHAALPTPLTTRRKTDSAAT